jgi:hypothetical protein
VPTLLGAMESKDARTAWASGLAFTRITGADIESDKRVALLPEDGSEPDDFEREFLEEVKLPCPERAMGHWLRVKDRFEKGTRWCRGVDLSKNITGEVLSGLDLESHWEACLRGKFDGTWHGQPQDLEVFPQKGHGMR